MRARSFATDGSEFSVLELFSAAQNDWGLVRLSPNPPEGPALIFYAALQHGFHFTFHSFRASAAHIMSPYLRTLRGRRPTPSPEPVLKARDPNAQNEISKAPRAIDPDGQAKRLGKKLGLNAEQIVLITPILADRQHQIERAQADESLTERHVL